MGSRFAQGSVFWSLNDKKVTLVTPQNLIFGGMNRNFKPNLLNF